MASNKEGMTSACDGRWNRKMPAVADQGQPKKVLVLPSTLVLEVHEQCHDMTGHFGLEKTLGKCQQDFGGPDGHNGLRTQRTQRT